MRLHLDMLPILLPEWVAYDPTNGSGMWLKGWALNCHPPRTFSSAACYFITQRLPLYNLSPSFTFEKRPLWTGWRHLSTWRTLLMRLRPVQSGYSRSRCRASGHERGPRTGYALHSPLGLRLRQPRFSCRRGCLPFLPTIWHTRDGLASRHF